MSTDSRLLRFVSRFRPGSSLFVVLFSLVALLASLLGNDDSVRRSLWPPNWDEPYQPYWPGLALVAAAAFAVVLGVWDARERRALPSENFLAGFSESWDVAHAAQVEVLRLPVGSLNAEFVAARIRVVLWALTRWLQTFERAPHSVRYSANIMVFIGVDSYAKNKDAADALRRELRFHGQAVEITLLPGVLRLRCDLSTTTQSTTGPVPDLKLKPLALPVLDNPLPGAPAALHRGGMDVVTDVFALADRVIREGGEKKTANNIRHFFESEQADHIRSFISVAIRRSGHDTEWPVGIVNVNRSAKGILRNPKTQELLLPHLGTLVGLLPEMLDVLADRERNEGLA